MYIQTIQVAKILWAMDKKEYQAPSYATNDHEAKCFCADIYSSHIEKFAFDADTFYCKFVTLVGAF